MTMTAHWIKVEKDTPAKPEVMRLAALLDIDEFTVVGHLIAFWSWVDSNLSPECPRTQGTIRGLDRIAGRAGFCEAMIAVGWLSHVDGVFEIPKMGRHMGKSAKLRAEDTEKKAKKRSRQKVSPVCPPAQGTESGQNPDSLGTREEKRREDSLYISGAESAKTEQLQITEQKASNEHLTTLLESGRTTGAEIEQREDVQKYAAEWIRHLEEKAPDKVPYVGTAHHGEFWALLHEIGPDRFVAAIRYTIRNGWLNIREEVKERKARGTKAAQPDTDPDFLRAVQVCKEFPSGSDFDREKRESTLGPELIRIVRKMTSARLAESDRFTQKQLAAEWAIVRECMK